MSAQEAHEVWWAFTIAAQCDHNYMQVQVPTWDETHQAQIIIMGFTA